MNSLCYAAQMKITLKSRNIKTCLEAPDGTPTFQQPASTCPADLSECLITPLELPRLPQCVVPGDRICIVVDPTAPEVVKLITQVRQQFLDTVSTELDFSLLLPADSDGHGWKSIIQSLPADFTNETAIKIHDPEDEQQTVYLASTAAGKRIYLNKLVVDADLIVTIGTIAWDSSVGIRGTTSGIYPTMSDKETLTEARRLSHLELNPADNNPRRDSIDEIGWLIGTQFTVQAIPDDEGNIGHLLCGAPEAVMTEGRQILVDQRQLRGTLTSDLILLSVAPLNDTVSWKDLGHAVALASRLASDETRIAVVADLPEQVGPALQMLQRCTEPEDLVKPLSLEPTSDALETIQLIQALRQSSIFLFSQLPTALVEDLGLLPIESTDELQRLLSAANHPAFIHGANFLAGN